jgi:hypothetical protein
MALIVSEKISGIFRVWDGMVSIHQVDGSKPGFGHEGIIG